MSACTFFGHRDCYGLDRAVLENAIVEMINKGVNSFYVGNQGNFDAMVYSCLKQLRKTYPHIFVSVVLAYLPTKKQENTDMSDTIYPEIEGYPHFAIDLRNHWMIEQCDHCICYIDHTWGGAYKFASVAKHQELKMINLGTISPSDL